MKNLLIGLVAILVVAILAAIFISATSYDLYKAEEHVTYTEVMDSDTPTVYYYYRLGCGYCESAKGQVSEFAKKAEETEDIDFKLVDVYAKENEDDQGGALTLASSEAEIKDPEEMKTAEDIKFIGTPGMVYIKDGKLDKYGVGEEIFDVLEYASDEHSLGLKFDRSVYGE